MHPDRMKRDAKEMTAEIKKGVGFFTDECKKQNTVFSISSGMLKAAAKYPFKECDGFGIWNELHGSFIGAAMGCGVQDVFSSGLFNNCTTFLCFLSVLISLPNL